jgi:glyoxylase-like metal-dependent hydrolase (beta-lactamase superfamily II)
MFPAPAIQYKGAATRHAGQQSPAVGIGAPAGLAGEDQADVHAHANHLAGGHWLRDQTGAPLVIGARIGDVKRVFAPRFAMDDLANDGRQFDMLLEEGATLPPGNLTVRVLQTAACVTYLIGDAAFVGDTLLIPDYGTPPCDFPGGDAAMLHASIQKILALPPETRIFVGRDYLPAGRSDCACETSVAAQKAGNIHVHDGVSADDFIAMRHAPCPRCDAGAAAAAAGTAQPAGEYRCR